MNILKTIAVDDEGPALRRLRKMAEKNAHLELVDIAKSAAEAKEKIIQIKPDLLLLDIELKDATAFELLSEIENHFTGKIIFITAYDQYAVKAFELEVVDYLLKPYTQERFDTAIRKIISKNKQNDFKDLMSLLKLHTVQPKLLTIPEGLKNHFIEKEKLYYLTGEGYYTNLILSEGKKNIRISLKKLEELLPKNFVRINKSTIINKDFVIESTHHKTTGKIVMTDKNEFYISENYLEKFRNLL